jgi:hypothetical protein
MESMKKSYQVDIDVISKHTYIIDEVNSPEEAEEVAKEWLDDGEDGTISDVEVFDIDAYPIEAGEAN